MDTSPGGETPQYESIDTDTKGHAKAGGQLSGVQTTEPTATDPLSTSTHHDTTRGEKTAENIRFGQAISEEGVGGFTNNAETAGLGESDAASDIRGGIGSGTGGGSSYGGAEAAADDEEAVKARRAQGYGGDNDADRSIGA